MEMHFTKLKVWEKAMTLAKNCYECTRDFPKEELYGLISQIRRAAVAVPSNIAEGSQRTSDKDFANFLLVAKGSLAELETQLLLAHELRYINEEHAKKLLEQIAEISRMLHSFHSKLVARSS